MNKESRISIRIEEDVKKKLEAIAESRGVSLAYVIRRAIDCYLKED